jgi:hypothetical protein
MSYVAYITRRSVEQGSVPSDITLEEWTAVVDSDPELSPDGDYRSVRWRGLSTVSDPTFDWHDGEIVVNGPDSAQWDKTLQLAKRLNACILDGDYDLAFKPEAEDKTAFGTFDLEELRHYEAPTVKWSNRDAGIGGVLEFLGYYVLASVPILVVLGGIAFPFVAARYRELQRADYIVCGLAACWLAVHLYYLLQGKRQQEFETWLLRHVADLLKGPVEYRGTPVTLDTPITRFSGAYSFFFSYEHGSRWYFVGVNDRGGKWIHTVVSILFGSWGFPFGPLLPLLAVVANLRNVNQRSVRNLCLELDDRLVRFVGRPDPQR